MGEDEEEVMAGHVTVMDESSASTRRIPSFMVFCVVGCIVKQCFVEDGGLVYRSCDGAVRSVESVELMLVEARMITISETIRACNHSVTGIWVQIYEKLFARLVFAILPGIVC